MMLYLLLSNNLSQRIIIERLHKDYADCDPRIKNCNFPEEDKPKDLQLIQQIIDINEIIKTLSTDSGVTYQESQFIADALSDDTITNKTSTIKQTSTSTTRTTTPSTTETTTARTKNSLDKGKVDTTEPIRNKIESKEQIMGNGAISINISPVFNQRQGNITAVNKQGMDCW